MGATNYFKAVKFGSAASNNWVKEQEFFTFNDRDPDDTRKAFEDAVSFTAARGLKLSVFAKPRLFGPWDEVPVIGVCQGEEHEA